MSENKAMEFGPDDVTAARATLAQARDGEVMNVVLLTDEEVMILDGLEHEQLVPTPCARRTAPSSRARCRQARNRATISKCSPA